MATPIKRVRDLDAELDWSDEDETPFKVVNLFGRDWRIMCDINTFSLAQIATGDPGAIARFITGVVHPDESEAFAAALGKVRNLTGEKLVSLLNKLVEVAGERPTASPLPSRRTGSKPTSVRKSTAR